MSHHWPVYGHDWAVEHLRKSLAHGRVRHAYLITGTEHIGKMTLARTFAMVLNCTHPDAEQRPCRECRACKLIASGGHPDISYAEGDANTGALKIEEVRRVAGVLALKPFEARHRIAIFPDFHRAQDRAQDALLKTLEEPPSYAVLILLAESTESLLATITSRSQIISLRPPSAEIVAGVLHEHFGVDDEQAQLLAGLCGGRIGWAIRALHEPALLEARTSALDLLERALGHNRAGRFALADDLGKDRLAIRPLLELWLTYWRDVLLLVSDSQLPIANADRAESLRKVASTMDEAAALKALQATRKTLDMIVGSNVNARLALEVMFLDYPGLN